MKTVVNLVNQTRIKEIDLALVHVNLASEERTPRKRNKLRNVFS